ncbi:hypothetical protein YC2023_005403 [Brassica napus]
MLASGSCPPASVGILHLPPPFPPDPPDPSLPSPLLRSVPLPSSSPPSTVLPIPSDLRVLGVPNLSPSPSCSSGVSATELLASYLVFPKSFPQNPNLVSVPVVPARGPTFREKDPEKNANSSLPVLATVFEPAPVNPTPPTDVPSSSSGPALPSSPYQIISFGSGLELPSPLAHPTSVFPPSNPVVMDIDTPPDLSSFPPLPSSIPPSSPSPPLPHSNHLVPPSSPPSPVSSYPQNYVLALAATVMPISSIPPPPKPLLLPPLTQPLLLLPPPLLWWLFLPSFPLLLILLELFTLKNQTGNPLNEATLAELWENGAWILPNARSDKQVEVISYLSTLALNDNVDTLEWWPGNQPHMRFSTGDIYDLLKPNLPRVPCFTWPIWKLIAEKCRFRTTRHWNSILAQLQSTALNKHQRSLLLLGWQATLYILWSERNNRLHRAQFSSSDGIQKKITLTVKNRISSLRSDRPAFSSALMQLWFFA